MAGELAEFIGRLDRGKSQIWHVDICGRVGASIAIDGEDLGDGKAHLRWFISDDRLQGQAVGTRLLAAALGFCDEQGFAETHLWTFEGLATARRLYARNGFLLAEQWAGRQWGEMVEEQRFVRLRPAPEGN